MNWHDIKHVNVCTHDTQDVADSCPSAALTILTRWSTLVAYYSRRVNTISPGRSSTRRLASLDIRYTYYTSMLATCLSIIYVTFVPKVTRGYAKHAFFPAHCCWYRSQPDLQYNIALCYYKTKQYGDSLRFLAEIIERGVREHPELSVGRWGRGVREHLELSVGRWRSMECVAQTQQSHCLPYPSRYFYLSAPVSHILQHR